MTKQTPIGEVPEEWDVEKNDVTNSLKSEIQDLVRNFDPLMFKRGVVTIQKTTQKTTPKLP